MKYYFSNPYLGRVLIALIGDTGCLALAVLCVVFSFPDALTADEALGIIGMGTLYFSGVLYVSRGYSPRTMGSSRASYAFIPVAAVAGIAAALFLDRAWVASTENRSQALIAIAVLQPAFLLAQRFVFRRVSDLPRFNQRVLLIGASELGEAIALALQQRPRLGIEMIGILSDEIRLTHPDTYFAGVPVLGRVKDLEKVLRDHNIGRIVVASKSREEHFPAEELLAAKLRRLRVESGIAFFERVTGRIYLRDLRPSYLIFSEGFHQSRIDALFKRLLDASVAAVGLILLAPLIGLAAIAIKLDSAGPIVYRQRRLGVGGVPFDVIKLRSMVTDAEASGPRFAQRSDCRITRVGGILRRTRIDELPQLVNILKGEMSLVGPRPERPEMFEELCDRYPYFRLRCSVKPGCTGWAQIRHGYVNEIDGFEEKLALDLFYLKYGSVPMDLMILWDTARTMLLLEGV